MKKLITIFLLLTAFTSNAQRTMFGGNNNYVAPVAPPTLSTQGLVLQVDGISVGTPIDVSSTSSLNPNSSDKFYIGSYGSSDGQSPLYFFKGNIGQALIYNRAITASEVTNNFNVLKSRFGL